VDYRSHTIANEVKVKATSAFSVSAKNKDHKNI